MNKQKKPWKKPQLVVKQISKECKSFTPGEPEKERGFMHCDGDGEDRCKLCKFYKP